MCVFVLAYNRDFTLLSSLKCDEKSFVNHSKKLGQFESIYASLDYCRNYIFSYKSNLFPFVEENFSIITIFIHFPEEFFILFD